MSPVSYNIINGSLGDRMKVHTEKNTRGRLYERQKKKKKQGGRARHICCKEILYRVEEEAEKSKKTLAYKVVVL
jgi:hypothetical protein